jgi:Right handed beta helix region
MISRVIWASVLLFSSTCTGRGATYYVSSSQGRETNDGLSERSAWRTIAQVNRHEFQPGDTIRLRRGDSWSDTLRLRSSGKRGRPIIVTGYGYGARPIISGAAIAIDNNEQSHIVYDGLELKTAQQGLRLYSWRANVENITLQNSVVTIQPAETSPRLSAAVYANTNSGRFTQIVLRNNFFYPYAAGLENWGVYFVNGVSHFRIEGNFFSAAGEDAITVWHGTDGVIARNRGGGNGENTIDVKDSQNIVIRNNTAVNDGEYNIVAHQVDPSPRAQHIVIRSNYCIGGGQRGSLTAGIALLAVRSSVVVANHIQNSIGAAILVNDRGNAGSASSQPTTAAAEMNEVRGNFLRHNGIRQKLPAIVVQGAPGTSIKNNYIEP